MAKGVYAGVNGAAKKVKSLYLGVNGVPKKAKKVYVGVDGVPKLVFNSFEPRYYGTITPMTYPAYDIGGASNNNYVMFAGGASINNAFSQTNAYNKSLVKVASTTLSRARSELVGGNIGNHLMFYGGVIYDGTYFSYYRDIDFYDGQLTRTSNSSAIGTGSLWGSKNSKYMMYAGGYSSGSHDTSVKAIDANLTVLNAPLLAVGRNMDKIDTWVGDYALFLSGNVFNTTSGRSGLYDVYNSNLVRSDLYELVNNRNGAVGGRIGSKYAIIGGGSTYTGSTRNVYDAYVINESLVMTRVADIDQSFSLKLSLNAEDAFVLVDSYGSSQTQIYDLNLVKTTMPQILLSPLAGQSRNTTTSFDGKAFVAGGYKLSTDNRTDTVTVFEF